MAHFGKLFIAVLVAMVGLLDANAQETITLGVTDDAQGVLLEWTGGVAPFEVFRAGAVFNVTHSGNSLGTTSAGDWTDQIFLPPLGDVHYYLVREVCGDGDTDPGEECDDGNDNDTDCCSTTCTRTFVCGNGLVDAPCETCDPPNDPVGPYGHPCRADCTFCGDAIIQNPPEICDDGGAFYCPDCIDQPFCGNGLPGIGETCDPPGAPAGASGNPCREDCTVCGDGVLDIDEDCDDGNSLNGDGCENDCTLT